MTTSNENFLTSGMITLLDLQDGDSIIVEYSVDGEGKWHSDYVSGDHFMRQKIGVYGEWTAPVRFVGEEGPQGLQGPAGNSGSSLFTWLKYADTIDGSGISDSPIGKQYIGLAYNKNIQTESSNPADYTWSLIRGDQGSEGPKGPSGESLFTWIKYADTPTTGISDDPNGKKYLGIAYNKPTATESSIYSDYSWSLIEGPKGEPGEQGLRGLQGDRGDQGIQGPIGLNGISSYTHIAYATDSTGKYGFSTSDSLEKTYIGMYVDQESTDSSDPTKYKWTLIKGADGTQGIQGPKGSDGNTSYLHVAYATNITGTAGFSVSDSIGKTYIGQYTDFTSADSLEPSKYSWTLIKGEKGDQGATGLQGIQGERGDQGIQGPKGPDGKSSYTHIAYSTSPSGATDFSTSDPTDKTYIGMYVDDISDDSTDPTKYKWTLIRGADGEKGIPGPTGASGNTSYLHIAYATNSTGTTGFSTTDPAGKTYIGQYTDFTSADSETPSKYSWTLIKGEKGNDGKGVSSVIEYYLATSSKTGVTTETAGWKTEMQTMTAANKYLWNYEKVTYSDSSFVTTAPVIIGIYGDSGKGISSVANSYLVSNLVSGVDATTEGWKATPGVMTSVLRYLWNFETITYTDGSKSTTTPAIIGVYGDKGATGSQGDTGGQGPEGNGIASVIKEFYLSTSKTTQVGGSWVLVQPEWKANLYLWTREKITYTNGNIVYTTPTVSSEWEAVNNIEIGGRNLIKFSSLKNLSSGISTKEFISTGWALEVMDNANVLSILKAGEEYTMTYDMEIIDRTTISTLYSLQCGFIFHSRLNNSHTLALTVRDLSNKGDKKRVSTTFICPPLTDQVMLVYTNRYTTNGESPIGMDTVRFTNFKLEKGNKPTDWTPAPEDTDEELNKKANSSEVYTKTETYTKFEADSQISKTKDAINLSVSNSYETKTNVDTKISKIQIGGRNLLKNSNFRNDFKEWTLSSSPTVSTIPFKTTGKVARIGVKNATTTENSWIGVRQDFDVKVGDEFVVSGWVYLDSNSDLPQSEGGLQLQAQEYNGTTLNAYNDSRLAYADNADNLDKWVRFEKSFIIKTATTNKLRMNLFLYKSGVIHLADLKLEKGNKATDWSPAPEDVDASINNIEIGGRNLLRESSPVGHGCSYVKTSEIYKKAPVYKITTNKDNVASNFGLAMVVPITGLTGGQFTVSFSYKFTAFTSATGVIGYIRVAYTDGTYGMFYMDIPGQPTVAANLNKWFDVNLTFATDPTKTLSSIHSMYFYKDLAKLNDSCLITSPKIERGNKVTDWTPAPEDTDSAINSKANEVDVYKKSETYTRSETIGQINVAKEAINLSVSSAYETKTNVEAKINNLEIGGRNLAFKDTLISMGGLASLDSKDYTVDGTLIIERKAGDANGGFYFDKFIDYQPSSNYVVNFKMKLDTGTLDNIYFHNGQNLQNTKIYIDNVLMSGAASVTIPTTVFNDKNYHYIRMEYKTPATLLDSSIGNNQTFLQPNKGLGSNIYKLIIKSFKVEKGVKATDWTKAQEDVMKDIDNAVTNIETMTKLNGVELLNQEYSSNVKATPFTSGTYSIVPSTELGLSDNKNLIKTTEAIFLKSDFIPYMPNNPYYIKYSAYNKDTTNGTLYFGLEFFDSSRVSLGSNDLALYIPGSGVADLPANAWRTYEGFINTDAQRNKASFIRIRILTRWNGGTGTTYLKDISVKQLGAYLSSELESRVKKAELKITDSAIISTVSNTINTAKSEAISSANANTANLLKSYSTTTQMNSSISQLSDQIALKVGSSEVTTAINNIQIGGRNLLVNTSNNFENVSASAYTGTIREGILLSDLGLKAGDKITASVYVKTSSGKKLCGRIDTYNSSNTRIEVLRQNTPFVQNGEGIIHVTGVIPAGTVKMAFLVDVNQTATTHTATTTEQYKMAKIEKGDKVTDWSPAPEDVDANIANIEIGGRNLARKSDLVGHSITPTVSENKYTWSTNSLSYGLRISDRPIENDKQYVLSYKFKKTAGTITKIGGHNLHLTHLILLDGVAQASYGSGINIPNDSLVHTVSIAFTGTYSNDRNLYIQPNRGGVESQYTIEVWDIKLERGNKSTDWTPAIEDIDESIGSKANVTDVYKKSETYTKTEANSAITIAKNEINLGVSNTYETKTNVETKINNIQVGGRNLFRNSGMFGTSVADLGGRWFDNGGGLVLDTANKWNEYNTIKTTVGAGIGGGWYTLENGVEYTYSMLMKADKSFVGSAPTPLHFHTGLNNLNENGTISIIKQDVTYSASDVGKYKLLYTVFKLTGNANSFKPFIYWAGQTINMNIAYLKLEKGNRATDWSPSPEDVNSKVDSKANSADVYKKSETYTRTEANAQITASKDAINLSVANTYETKTNVETKINNIQIGGRNYATKAKIQATAIIGTTTGATLNKAHADCPNGFYIVNNETKTATIRMSNIIPRNGLWTVSFDVKGNQGSAVGVGVDICDAGGTVIKVNADNTWRRVSVTANVTNFSTTFHFIDFVPDWAHLFIRNIKVEEGNKATDWTPAPEDVDSAINAKANSSEVYTKTQADAAIKLGTDGVLTSVSNSYLNKADATSTYATKSLLSQTSDNLTASFKSSGGYNLIRNSTGYNGTNLWTASGATMAALNNNNTGGATSMYLYLDNGTKTTESYAFSRRFKLKASTKYTVSGWFHSYTMCPSFDVMVLTSTALAEADVTQGYTAATTIVGAGNTNGVWKKYSVTFTTPAGTLSGILRIDNNGYNASGTGSNRVHWNALMLNEGEEQPWSPHPSEIYDGSTVIDASGVTVKNGGLKILNNAGSTVLSADTAGNLLLSNSLTVGGSGNSGVISIKNSSGKIMANINREGIYVNDGNFIITNASYSDPNGGASWIGYPTSESHTLKGYGNRIALTSTVQGGSSQINEYSAHYGSSSMQIKIDDSYNASQTILTNSQNAMNITLLSTQTNGTLISRVDVKNTGLSFYNSSGSAILSLNNNQGLALASSVKYQAPAMELRGNGGTPYLDFTNDVSGDYDARLLLSEDDILQLHGARLDVMSGGVRSNGWFTTIGTHGWYSETYGGGWSMTDTTWIRSYGGKNVYVDKTMRADVGFQVGDNGNKFNVASSGAITSVAESKFSNGAFTDPLSGTACAIKASGRISADHVHADYFRFNTTPSNITGRSGGGFDFWLTEGGHRITFDGANQKIYRVTSSGTWTVIAG